MLKAFLSLFAAPAAFVFSQLTEARRSPLLLKGQGGVNVTSGFIFNVLNSKNQMVFFLIPSLPSPSAAGVDLLGATPFGCEGEGSPGHLGSLPFISPGIRKPR